MARTKRKWRGGGGGSYKNKKTHHDRRDRADRSHKKRGDGSDRGDWGEWVYRNPNFEMYYQAMGIVPEGQWEAFMAALGRPLPATFRINELCVYGDQLEQELREYAGTNLTLEGGKEVPVVSGVEWFPGRAFKMPFDRRELRKNVSLKRLHKWFVMNSEAGGITRQEMVSMVPPLMLDVNGDHRVLDLCAAPGSKTSQMLEMLHSGRTFTPNGARVLEDSEDLSVLLPSGFVLANDLNVERAYMLVHQCKRVFSPNLVTTCIQGQQFPELHGGRSVFDRVLADVPCSGDGTLRKNPEIWRKWKTMSGVQLHAIQKAIALRGAGLLAVGGRIVYSTCSLNPIEDEAVVAEILRETKGSLRLVDCSDRFPQLVRHQGLSTWPVLFDRRRMLENPKDSTESKPKSAADPGDEAKEAGSSEAATEEARVPPASEESANDGEKNEGTQEERMEEDAGDPLELAKRAGFLHYTSHGETEEGSMANAKLSPSMFPPTQEEAQEMHLERCMRFLPHDLDTGGFFVALLEKVAPLPSENEDSGAAENTEQAPRGKGNGKSGSLYQDYRDVPEKVFEELKDQYGLSDKFKRENLVTGSDACRTINFVPQSVRECIVESTKTKSGALKVVWMGIKVFDRNPKTKAACQYRVSQDGLPLVLPFMTKRCLRAGVEDFARIARGGMQETKRTTLSKEFLDRFSAFETGVVVVILDASLSPKTRGLSLPDVGSRDVLAITTWRGKGSILNVLASKETITNLRVNMRGLGIMPEEEARLEKEAEDSGKKFLMVQEERVAVNQEVKTEKAKVDNMEPVASETPKPSTATKTEAGVPALSNEAGEEKSAAKMEEA